MATGITITTAEDRGDGTWAAVVSTDGVPAKCDHRHGHEKTAQGCAEWQEQGLAKGADRWKAQKERAARPRKQMPTFAVPASTEKASDEELANSHEYVPSKELLELEIAVATGATRRPAANLSFFGPSGSGKTDGARDFAARMGLPFVKVDAASMTDPESWFGTRELVVEDGAAVTKYQPSDFAEWLTKPCVLLIDEITRVRDEHRNVLVPVLDHTRSVMNPLTGEVIQRHPQCFIVMAGNVGINFTGTNAIDPAFTNRSRIVEFDYIDEANELRIVQDASQCDADTAYVFVRLATEARAKAKIDEDFQPVSTRQIIEAARDVVDGLSRDLAFKFNVLNAYSGEGGSASIRTEVQSIWNGVRNSRPEPTVTPQNAASSKDWVCPTHGTVKVIPAGRSAQTGKPYSSFKACGTFGCKATEDKNPNTTPVQPTAVNGVVICPDCNDPQPAGRSTLCVNCGASLK